MNRRYSIWREGDKHKESGGWIEMQREDITSQLNSFLLAILKHCFNIVLVGNSL